MSFTPVNISPPLPTDGILYADSVVLTATEADLANLGGISQSPASIDCKDALYLFASIKIVIAGSPGSGVCWVAIETQLADGTWYDLAWVEKAAAVGNGTYNNAFGSNSTATSNWTVGRTNGTDPGATGLNGLPLAGRLRFTGKTTFDQGTATVTIYYKLQGKS